MRDTIYEIRYTIYELSEVNSMKVRLINYTKDPEKIVAQSARLCYSALSIEDLEEKLTNESII